MLNMSEPDIGGAIVRRRVARGGLKPLLAGQRLSRDEVLAMPVSNRRALVSTQHIELFPRDGAGGERHIVHLGRGQYDVIEGRKLTAAPVSKEEAEELATRP